MDLKEIQTILEANTQGGVLTLPPNALASAPIAEAFKAYLLDASLVVKQVSIVPVGGQNVTVVGQGASFPFENTYLTAIFTAPNGTAAMSVEADGFYDQTTVWRFGTAFPVMASTFFKDLRFTAAVLTLRTSNFSVSEPAGLSFDGTQELSGPLAVIGKLLNGSNEVGLSGPISIQGDQTSAQAVPVMVLADPEPGRLFGMEFIYQLNDGATVTEPREGTDEKKKTVPVPEIQLVSRITVDAEDGKKSVDIETHFTPDFTLLTFQANMDQLLVVGQAALNSLARGANLGRVLPTQLPLINRFMLGQWSMSVIPQIPRIASITMGVGIAEPWEVIPGFFTLEKIDFVLTVNYVGEKYVPTAALTAQVKILKDDPAEFTLEIDAQYPSYVITGALEEDSKIDLIALVNRFLGERIANSLPCENLKVAVLTLLIDPKNSTFTFETVITSDCTVDLAIAKFTLTQIDFNFNYVAGKATGSFRAAFWLVPPGPEAPPPWEWLPDDPPRGAVAMEVSAAYNGEEDGWSFRGGLAPDGKIDLGTLIGLYLPPSYAAFIPDVVINQLEAGFETGVSKSYDFAIGAEWTISLLNVKLGALVKIGSTLEEEVRKYEGEVQGFLRFGGDGESGGLELKVTAKFNDESKVYIFEFLGWTATMSSTAKKKTLTFEAGNRSLGEMIEVLINAVIPGADIKLAAPFSVLNSIPLGSFKFVVEFDPEDSSPKSAGLTYSPKINLGFAQIDDIALDYEVATGRVMFRITKGRFLTETIGPENPVEWDVADPDTTPEVPGEGDQLFRLEFLGMGQHMAVADKNTGALQPVPASIFGAITQLNDAFAGKNDRTLVFNEATDWLIATRFIVIQAIDLGFVFYDPELYGLVVSVTGSQAAKKVPVFDGLVFEILYKRISDTVGMWQIDLTLPKYIRNLQFGAVSVTLPSMKLQIYTNGDFLVDLGFPANDDFSRSFSLQVLPFVGSGGVYFGVLSSETSDRVPKTQKGNFSPVIAFGLGLRVGLGKDLDYGILKAGLSITVQGILEGIFAWYSPYPDAAALSAARAQKLLGDGSNPLATRNQLAAAAGNEDAFYYMIQAKVALVGKLYGSVNLGIISANLDLEIRISVRLTLEAYRSIEIFFEVRISFTLAVKVNLGLFKITIKLSFKMTLSFGFKVGSNTLPPWGQTAMLRQSAFMRQLSGPAAADDECSVIPEMKWQPIWNPDPVAVPLLFVPQLTAGTDGPLGTGAPRKPYVVAMTYVSSSPSLLEPTSPTPFDQVARGALLWSLNAYLNRDQEHTTLEDILARDVTIDQLKEIYCYLTQEDQLEPFTEEAVLEFLEHFYRFEVSIPPSEAAENVSVFPVMPLLKLTTSTGVDVDFFKQTPASVEYLESVKKYFEQMAVRYRTASERVDNSAVRVSREETDKSLASFIFLDFFSLLARSTVQDAINLLQAQEAPLEAGESLADLTARRPDLAIDVLNLVHANATRPLRAGVQLRVPGAVYTVKHGDTIPSIAAKLRLDHTEMRQANPALNGQPPAPASRIKLPTLTFSVSATEPESLLDITRIYNVSLTELAHANRDVPELFAAGQRLLAPYAQQSNVGALVDALQANGSFGNLSGLAARTLLQGLRPPSPENSPQAGEPAPLYELTGQQFDASDLIEGSTVTLNVEEATSEWFQLGPNGDSLTYTVTTETAAALSALKTTPFGPPVTFEPAKLLRVEPRRFTLATGLRWHTPAAIEPVNRTSAPPETIEPLLWQFPSELQQVITGPQALQPKVELWTQRQEGPGQIYEKEPVTNYTWSTTIKMQIRQTASGDLVFLPNTYELTGIDAGGTQLLENLIRWYSGGGMPVIEKLRILFPPDPAVEGQEVPPDGLKSDADPTFFLLQTNLSTASQPPQGAAMSAALAAAAPPHAPLGQTELEFIELLWESSIVNSGGYILYYQTETGSGLPDYLFSEDGVAPLTLLITYSITDNVLQNFLNNVVIRQVIDTENEVLYASPVPQTVANYQLSPDESLAEIAARFRTSIARLATQGNNSQAELAVGKHLRIPPRTRRWQPREKIAAIAAEARVTREALAAANPGVNFERRSGARFLRLPETVWRVQTDDSLASIAERFNVGVVTLAHANRDVPGLLAAPIEFDDRLEEAIATVPAGNVAFKFTRPNAGAASEHIDAGKQLSELYNLLAYRIAAGDGFERTNSALPVSPATPEGSTDWIYESVVPVYPFATPSANPDPGVPDPRQNPYNGIGKTAELNFNWQDLFGNWIDSDLQNQDWPNQGFAVLYTDNLIGLDQWPSVTSDYVIGSGVETPELSITLRFNAETYLPSGDGTDPDEVPELALTDLDQFRRIYYQLSQPDVTVTISSTMQAPASPGASDGPREILIQWVLEIIDFLNRIVAGESDPPAPADAAMSQPVADANPANLFALTVRLAIERDLDLVSEEFKDVPAVTAVSSRVPANAGQKQANAALAEPSPPLSLQEFARQLETAFPSLKVLVAAPKTSLGEATEEIWIARFAATATGIAFTIDGSEPSFFASAPLAQNLLSRPEVLVYPYQSGKFIGNEIPITTAQNSVDLDQLGRDFLAAVEEVLGPQFSAATWKLEYEGSASSRPAGEPPDPQTNPYEAIIAAKDLLATAISAQVANVFVTNGTDAGLPDAAELLRQQLLVDLTSAFTVDVIMQYPVDVTHSEYSGDDLFAPRLFGKPVTDNPDDPNDVEKKDAFSFSTGKFSLAKRATGTHLTFTFDTNREQQGKDGTQLDDVFTIDLFHQINALEHQIHTVPGIEGYLASSWLTFVLPDSFDAPGERKLLVPLGKQTIPVPLRAYPTPPSLSEQNFIPHVKQFVGSETQSSLAGPDQLLKARRWNYRCRYEYVGAAHDKILASVKLNVPPEGALQARLAVSESPDLFAALVQFSAAYPGIARDLDQYLATGTDPEIAFNAISSFAWLTQRAAEAWFTWREESNALTAAKLESPEYYFVITQRAEEIDAITALVVTVTWDPLSARLPQLPEVAIPGYATKVRSETADSAAYYYLSEQDAQVLTYEVGRDLSTRHMLFKDLDILKVENAWAGAAIKRNEDLLPGKTTNPDFIFQSPVIRFANVLTPLLDPADEIDIADFTPMPPAILATYLSNFLIAFFEQAQIGANENRTIRLGVSYSYRLEDSGKPDPVGAELPNLEVAIPILLTTPTSISILSQNLSPDSPFIAAIAATVTNWLSDNSPSGIDNSGRLWFDLSVYSSLSESQLPVLRMRRLYLNTRSVVFHDSVV